MERSWLIILSDDLHDVRVHRLFLNQRRLFVYLKDWAEKACDTKFPKVNSLRALHKACDDFCWGENDAQLVHIVKSESFG